MPIEYEVALNKLTTPTSYAARVRPQYTVRLNDLLKDIASSCTVTPADINAVVTAFIDRVQTELARGNNVSIDGLGIYGVRIKAKMAQLTDPLPSDYKILVSVRPDRGIVQSVRGMASLARVEQTSKAPLLLVLTAWIGSVFAANPGSVYEIVGDRLAFDPAEPDEGVFFVPVSTGSAVRATNYLYRGEKRVAEDTIADVDASGIWPGKVVTTVEPVGPYWEAEPEHQDYLERIPDGYTCHWVRPNWKLPRRSAGPRAAQGCSRAQRR